MIETVCMYIYRYYCYWITCAFQLQASTFYSGWLPTLYNVWGLVWTLHEPDVCISLTDQIQHASIRVVQGYQSAVVIIYLHCVTTRRHVTSIVCLHFSAVTLNQHIIRYSIALDGTAGEPVAKYANAESWGSRFHHCSGNRLWRWAFYIFHMGGGCSTLMTVHLVPHTVTFVVFADFILWVTETV